MSRVKEESKFLFTYKFRAYPTALQEYKLENWLFALCWLYNHALEERKRIWKEEGRTVKHSEQQNNLPKLKKKEPILKLVHSQVLQDTLFEKQKKRVAKMHEKIKNARRDFLHKLSRKLVRRYHLISFEELDISNLVENNPLAKLILDAGWGTLITLAERIHRCPRCGIELDRDYNASIVIDKRGIEKEGLTQLTGGRVGATLGRGLFSYQKLRP